MKAKCAFLRLIRIGRANILVYRYENRNDIHITYMRQYQGFILPLIIYNIPSSYPPALWSSSNAPKIHSQYGM